MYVMYILKIILWEMQVDVILYCAKTIYQLKMSIIIKKMVTVRPVQILKLPKKKNEKCHRIGIYQRTYDSQKSNR